MLLVQQRSRIIRKGGETHGRYIRARKKNHRRASER